MRQSEQVHGQISLSTFLADLGEQENGIIAEVVHQRESNKWRT
jgi:hypothetical protein